jgi:uncharacterized damage-inducible protein DinB
MGDVRASIVEQLTATQDGDPWFGSSARTLLAGLTPADAAAHPIPGAHSIWMLVLHMTAWKREVRRRLGGGVPALPADGDWPAVSEISDAAWQRAQEDLAAAHAEIVEAIRSLPPHGWERPIGDLRDPALGTGVEVSGMIVGLAQHDAYHIGQIALTRRALANTAR